jgi:broad specificity phosphatase PhoE
MRHGETDWNRSNRIMGQTDIPLNEKGIRQAHDAKEILMTMEFANIYSSPLQRARQTAEILKGEFGHPIDYIDHLKERGWGKEEGQLSDFKGIEITTTNIPEGAEHYSALETRVILALKEILAQPSKPPLIISHGGIFMVLTKLLAHASLPLENCSLYFFRPPEHPKNPWFIVKLSEP